MKSSNAIRSAVRQALYVGAITTATSYAPLASAQESADEVLEEITVTGTRIQRQDFQSASPIVSLSSEAFEQTGIVNAEELVNQLPQIVPSFSSGNNNPGNGQSWINLRGLGSSRNLVLIDGKRPAPSNEFAIVDINTIPTAMIERVEVVSGGASAVYGSEAIAGATNFILKTDFNGIDLSGQYSISAEGDTEKNSFDLVMGSDLADGKGNATMWVTYNDRERLGKGEREFSAQAVSGTSFFPSGHVRRASGNSWTLASVQDVFTNLYGAAAPSVIGTLVGNDDGTLFTQGGAGEGIINFREVIGEDIDGLFVAQNFRNGVIDTDTYSYNFEPWNNLVIPQKRWNMGGTMNLAITDNVEAYSRLMFTNYSSSTQLAPSPAPTSPNITIPDISAEFTVPVTNPFVVANAGLSQILASRTGDNPVLPGSGAAEDFIYRRRFIENGPRKESYERDVYQILVGVRGDITDRWRFDVWGANAKYNEQLQQDGNVSVTRVESLLDAADGGVSICEGGLNPIGANTLSQECADYVGALAKNNTRIEQNQFEAVVTGDVFSLPAGDASVALGFFYHDMTFGYFADELLASGDVSGFNVEDNIVGSVRNTDWFFEGYVPLLADIPAIQQLGLTVGYRTTDHNRAGTFDSYKEELDCSIIDSVRVRTSFQQAVRAPNVGELFSPLNEDNPQVTDPCNFDSGARSGPDAAQVEALCVAQGILAVDLPTYKQSTSQIDALRGGNPDLEAETADTFTFGVVWQPGFAESLQVSVDYFNIEVTDVITFIDPSTVTNRCFNTQGFNPSYDVNNEWCQRFERSAGTGEIKDLLEIRENIGGLRTDGIDLQVDYAFEMGNAGSLGLNFVATYMNEFAEQAQPGDPWVDFKGTIGDDAAEVYAEWKAVMTGIWDIGNFSTALRFRYIDAMAHEQTVIQESTDPDICDCTPVDSVVYADLSAAWQATDELSVRLGIDNLLDEEPQLYTPDQDSGTNPSVYDVIGRRYYVTLRYAF
jgi:outer membrane receptor protein involved in Fe transport